MASGATFHAKITADAREFIAQVEGAQEALKGLIQETKGAGKAGKTGQASKASKAKKEQKTAQQDAMRAADAEHQKEIQNIKKENEERRQGGAAAILAENRLRKKYSADQTKDIQKRIRESRQLAEAERTILRDGQFGTGFQRAAGPLRPGTQGLKDLRVLQQRYNQEKRKQLSHEREIAAMNRQQLDAMVTGRYALYDMANAYQQIATYAFRVASATSQVVMTAGAFESAFTSFERAAALQTGTAQFDYMFEVLKDLSTQIPITFEQISEIATLGAQMGVATGDIANFTETIAKFSSITGATIDETAEKFGRLSALANIPVEEFENLASSVIYAGFNAVATEQEILAMSESIAAAAGNAGYTGKQVVGLATALSSLGIPLERARGSILRIFGNITRAIEGGSDKLQDFAAAAGVSASEAQYLWKESPEEFFTALLNGLGTVENLTLALDKLGIVNTREVDVIQRLSGNMDVYSQSLREAAQAYDENTALADIYSKTADNLEAKITLLTNAFESFKATLGEATAETVKPFVDLLISLTKAATEFSKTGIGAIAIPAIGGISGLVAALAGITFVGKLATAQLLAMRVAVLKTGQSGVRSVNVFRGLKNAITGNLYVTDELGGRTQFLTKQQINAAKSSGALDKQTAKNILSTGRATKATRFLAGSMSALSVVMGVVMVASIGAMLYELDKQNAQVGKNIGGIDAFADAVEKDSKIFEDSGRAIATFTTQLVDNEAEFTRTATAGEYFVDTQGDIERSVNWTTRAINKQTDALGENFKQLLLQDMLSSDDFRNLSNALEEAGTDINSFLDAIGVDWDTYIKKLSDDPKTAIKLLNEGIYSAIENIDELPPALQSVVLGLADVVDGSNNTATELVDVEKTSIDVRNALYMLFGGIGRAIGATQEYIEMKRALGLEEQSSIEKNLEYMDSLEGTEDAFDGVSSAMRTVIDYASDLRGIFDRIIDIEFGTTEAEDDIADAWEKIADRADKAREAIEDANNEIKELTADRAVLEYQLSVAERYGDERRAMQIRAKLGEVDAKLADETEKLTEAQDEASMTLEGQTKAARENRDAVDDLVGSYINLIEAAVESGMQGEELEKYIESLKEEFYANGEAVGYSRDELDKYAELFDQFKTAVREVDPRINVQFDTNLSAVQNALNEFKAKLDSTSGTYSTEIKMKLPDPRKLYPIINKASEMSLGNAFMWGRINARQYYMAVYGIDLNNYKYAQGGFVSGPGTPTSDSIPAMLSNGEYVIQAKAVSSYGVDFMNAINQQRVPMTALAPASAAVSGGSTIAYLAPEDRALLRAVADRPVTLYADNTKIAQSANAGNQTLSQRGLK